jgi:4-amino-4-deoxy-L-arabinose transferase-like glycosyltransferase
LSDRPASEPVLGRPSAPPRSRSQPADERDQRHDWLAVLLILVHFLLLVGGLQKVYLTADEPAYIAGGYALLVRGREALPFLAQRGYPPLLAGLEALPLYLANPSIPVTRLDGWPASFDTFTGAFGEVVGPWQGVLLGARLPTIWLTVLLGAVVYRLARSLWGRKAGWLALTVLVFDPSLLAHGRLAHTDAGSAALGTISLYVVWRWSRAPHWRPALMGGCLLGLTMLSKASGPLWVAAAIVQIGVVLIQRWSAPRAGQTRLQAFGVLAAGAAVFWSGYAFTWGTVGDFPVPLPAPAYWESILYLQGYTTEVFALGRRWYQHLWWYYPVAFLIKNPLLLLAGALLGGLSLLRQSRWQLPAMALGAFPLLYLGSALLTGMNIGYRHMLPIHPFLYLIVGGGLAAWLSGRYRWRRWALIGGLVAYAGGTLWISPQELSYFNQLVGGPAGGYRYLGDSNVDWGQTPPQVTDAYVQANPGTIVDPPAAPYHPAAGQYLVSAAHLQGAGVSDPFAYEWFRHQEPSDSVNYALLAYSVPAVELTWAAQCAHLLPPLDGARLQQGTGRDDLRLIEFDCAQSWIYPAGKQASGVYAFRDDLFDAPRLELPSILYGDPAPRDDFVTRHLGGARLSFVKERADKFPPFLLYEAHSLPESLPDTATGYPAPADQPPATMADAEPPPDTPSLDGIVSFLGIRRYTTTDEWEVETWWRVDQAPITRPFSVMAHLTPADGPPIAVADGLGISPLALQPGDLIVQRHRFTRPPDGADYWLRTGVYWLDTLELWHMDGAQGADSILVFLGTPSGTAP